jgi:ABC-type antimicrobial peptide transport system permease subunit
MNVVVRAAGQPPDQLTQALRRTVSRLDPMLALSNIRPLTAAANESIARERYTTLLLSMLAATALVLGAIGVYGVVSHAVSAMRHELGVRIALGASRPHLYMLVIRLGLRLLIVGLLLGVAGAYASSKALTSLLFETAPTDPLVFSSTVMLVAATTLAACLLPARRAANVDPITAIRGVD